MRLHVLDHADDVARAAADIIAASAAASPGLTLGLPTGATPIPLYRELTRRFREGSLDLSRARGFNLDELVLPAGHPKSFRRFMERHVWERTGLEQRRCDIPSPQGDLSAECRRYNRALRAAGGLDLAILGIGCDGHVAYNLPGPPRRETHLVQLPEALADSLSVPASHRPLRAMTIGLAPLRSARQLLLLATGAAKAAAIKALVEGPENHRWPCTELRGHERFDLLVDRGAASRLKPRP